MLVLYFCFLSNLFIINIHKKYFLTTQEIILRFRGHRCLSFDSHHFLSGLTNFNSQEGHVSSYGLTLRTALVYTYIKRGEGGIEFTIMPLFT